MHQVPPRCGRQCIKQQIVDIQNDAQRNGIQNQLRHTNLGALLKVSPLVGWVQSPSTPLKDFKSMQQYAS